MRKQKPQRNQITLFRSIKRRVIRLSKGIRKAITPPKVTKPLTTNVMGHYYGRWYGLQRKSVVGIQNKPGVYMPHIGGGMYKKARRKGLIGALS